MHAVTLFSGCGGLDLGIEQAGFEIALATDNNPLCERSHRANFSDVPFLCVPIEKLTSQLLSEHLGGLFTKIDLLAGGPPCPPYSKSRFYRTEKPRGIDDEVGDTTLRGYLKILGVLKPRAFLLENVAGFNYGVHRAGLDLVLKTATKLNYSCAWRVLNAADYGLPQIRERFFLVGLQGDREFEFPAPTHRSPSSVDDLFSAALPPWATAGEALSDLDTDDDDAGHKAGGKHHDLLKLVPPGDNYLYFTAKRGHPSPLFEWRSRYWSFLLKLSPSMPSWTIQARRSNNMGPFHWKSRILRIPEVLRLQGFPDHWQLSGNVEQQWRQVGNAVPPRLASILAKSIREQLSRRVSRIEESKRRRKPVQPLGARMEKRSSARDSKRIVTGGTK